MSISSIGGYYSNGAQGLPKTQNRQNMPADDAFSALTGAASGAQKASGTDAATKFMNYMKETPAQRFQDSWLAQHGLSQAQFDAMSAAEKEKIIAQMKQEIEQKAKEQMTAKDHKPVDMVV